MVENTDYIFKTKLEGYITQLSTDGNNTCGVNVNNDIFCKLNNSPNLPWRSINGKLKQISTYNGKLYGVNSNDDIYYADNLNNVVWKNIPGKAKQVSMYENKVCGVNVNNDIFCKNNLTESDWFSIAGKLNQVSFYKGILAGVNSNNDMFYTTDINKPNSLISLPLEGKFKQVDVNDFGFCGITPDNNLVCKSDLKEGGPMEKTLNTTNNNWKYVDSKNGIYGINSADEVYSTDSVNIPKFVSIKPISTIKGTIALRSRKTNKICAVEGDKIKCDRDSINQWEKFNIENLGDNYIAIRGGKDNKYCSDDVRIQCNRDSINQWEKFKIVPLENNHSALIGGRQGKYCTHHDDNTIACDGPAIKLWENFKLESI